MKKKKVKSLTLSTSPEWQILRGSPLPFGAFRTDTGINFALFSRHATAASLVLFQSKVDEVWREIPLDPFENKTGDVWHLRIQALPDEIRYGWRLDGPRDTQAGHRFDPAHVLLDPFAYIVSGGHNWGEAIVRNTLRQKSLDEKSAGVPFSRRACLPPEDFDWRGDRPPRTPMSDTIIYELHVRGYTADPSAQVQAPGTFLGLTEKISYLKELGVTAVELMPIFEFDENENDRHHPLTGEPLLNFWGYSPISFFAPKAAYAADSQDGRQVNECKEMIRRFHAAGLEVFLDVVFNHTAEGDERGPTLSFRGIDNSLYYLLTPDGRYRNFSGCGNTLNCNHPVIREMIIDCLHYWVAQMHVDGFRFDLASILGRGADGEVLSEPPLLERIAGDPVLADTKIIAEAWDAAGLNQVGEFPSFGRWAEWNGYYRDDVRMFWRGDPGLVSRLASRLCGSDDLYNDAGRGPHDSINFVTAHDGFTMYDLVSYCEKHNYDNGEENHDGEKNNHSQNFGVEGHTDDANIRRLRTQQVKNYTATLLLSQGVPMLLAGDEFCRTQNGNNNAYCQDNAISWVQWDKLETCSDTHRFARLMIAFRRRHQVLRRRHFFSGTDHNGDNLSDISWHGEKAYEPDWSEGARWLAFLLDGGEVEGRAPDAHLFVMLNAAAETRHFEVPQVGREWRRVIDTARPSPEDIFEAETNAPAVGYHDGHYAVAPRSVVVLVGE